MFGKKHTLGILFWHEDDQKNLWVLIGRAKEKPDEGKWTLFGSPQKGRCFSLGTKQFFLEQQNTAQVLAEELLGFAVRKNKLVRMGTNSLLYANSIYSMKLHAMLLPRHARFHMFMWSRIDMLPPTISPSLKKAVKAIEQADIREIS